jgi:hypothetical protein
MSRRDIPPLDTIRDADQLMPYVRRTARETWLDPDWLWGFCKAMQDSGLPTERTVDAIERQRQAFRMSPPVRAYRYVHLKAIRGYWDY